MADKERILALLKQEVAPAMGCTEPAAVALAASYAAKLLSGKVTQAELWVSPNVLKNGMRVGIPGTELIGLEIAAALGICVANPEKNLEVLAELEAATIIEANLMLADAVIKTYKKDTQDKIWIEVRLSDGVKTSLAILRWRHNWLHHLEMDGKVYAHNELDSPDVPKLISPDEFTVADYYAYCVDADESDLNSFDMGLEINRSIAEYGLSNASGISVGKMLMQQMESGLLGNDIHHYAMALTAAATDARMSGCSMPVISNSGSGNQGLSVTLPIIAIAEKQGYSKAEVLRALALGHLVSVHIKNKVGVLSSLCGCLSASSGAASGIVMLLGGKYKQIEYAIKNMIGNTAGMVCDGAKEGCSLKVATNTSAAVQAALLAVSDICVSSSDGIITDDLDETIANLAEFVAHGMDNADSTILNIMIKNNNRGCNV